MHAQIVDDSITVISNFITFLRNAHEHYYLSVMTDDTNPFLVYIIMHET